MRSDKESKKYNKNIIIYLLFKYNRYNNNKMRKNIKNHEKRGI